MQYRQTANGYVNFDPRKGAVDFCYRPFYDHTDNLDHMIVTWDVADFAQVTVRKASGANNKEIHANLGHANGLFQVIVLPQNYSLQTNHWYRVTMSWVLDGTDGSAFRIWIDGQELPIVTPVDSSVNMPAPTAFAHFGIGSRDASDNWSADGIIDEFYVYSSPVTP